jgi:integrase/recombinase XerD
MTTAVPSTALATIQPAFTDRERLALAGFLAGYRGLTREAYALDLRQFTTWCRARSLNLFAVRRADIEGFARDLEAHGRARATVTRRLCTIAGFYGYAVEEGTYSEIVWLLMGRIASTRTNANRTTGLPNSYRGRAT